MSTENPVNSDVTGPGSEGAAEAGQPQADTPQPPGKKPRSKVERIIVWGLIGFLVLLVAAESFARYGYTKTLEAFESALAAREKKEYDDKNRVSLKEFKKDILHGFASESHRKAPEKQQTIEFTWTSIFHKYRLDLVVSGKDALVMAYSTSNGVKSKVSAGRLTSSDEELEPPDMMGMGGGPGGAGPGGGGPGGRGPGGGGPGGGRRGRGPRGLLGQLSQEAVQTELNLSDEQKTKLQELSEGSQPDQGLRDMPAEERAKLLEDRRKETEAKVREILDEKQFARARQLELHSRGAEALSRDDVAAELGLTPEQKTKIAGIFESLQQKRQDMFQQVQTGEIDRGEIRGKMTELRDTAQKDALAVLSETQQEAWKKLLGPAPPEGSERPQRPRSE